MRVVVAIPQIVLALWGSYVLLQNLACDSSSAGGGVTGPLFRSSRCCAEQIPGCKSKRNRNRNRNANSSTASKNNSNDNSNAMVIALRKN